MVQEHRAARVRWDFRLELGRVLKAWAIATGPSMHPADRRPAVQAPDHPRAGIWLCGGRRQDRPRSGGKRQGAVARGRASG